MYLFCKEFVFITTFLRIVALRTKAWHASPNWSLKSDASRWEGGKDFAARENAKKNVGYYSLKDYLQKILTQRLLKKDF
ncbi:MAG: hypothetical protein PHU71_06940, partial [Candidatus Gracilibacteria bacterium]|nr:hypothetical protein [Candidatus Gracilibacteria bacterium]